MSDIESVSNEQDLARSLDKTHKVTIITEKFDVEIFNNYNIEYCYRNCAEQDSNGFYALKHVFHPAEGAYVLENNVYSELLNKIQTCNHSVAFCLSIKNVKLLRLCQIFLGVISNSSKVAYPKGKCHPSGQPDSRISSSYLPIPYIIGKKTLSNVDVPVWSYYWQAIITSLDNKLRNGICRKSRKDFYYSKTGLDWLKKMLQQIQKKNTNYKKRLLYCFELGNEDFQCRQSIEGPHELLDSTLIVDGINMVADRAFRGLQKYRTHGIDGRTLSLCRNLDNSTICEQLEIYNTKYGFELMCQMLFDDYYSNFSSCDKNYYIKAFGSLAEPTTEAIKLRINAKAETSECLHDGMGNLHYFKYKLIDNNWVAVWPEGRDDILSKILESEKKSNAFTPVCDTAKQVDNNPRAKVTEKSQGGVPVNKMDIPRKNKVKKCNQSTTVTINKLDGLKKFSITVNDEERKATEIQVLKFLAIYAANKTQDAHFLFQNNGEIIIRIGQKTSNSDITLKPIFSSSKNVNSDIDKIMPVFLPAGAVLNEYIEKTGDGEFPSYQSRKEVKFHRHNNLSVTLDAAAKDEIKTTLTNKSASPELINFILAVI